MLGFSLVIVRLSYKIKPIVTSTQWTRRASIDFGARDMTELSR